MPAPQQGGLALRLAVGTAMTAALASAAWLWNAYGVAVFFETIRAGFVACFG